MRYELFTVILACSAAVVSCRSSHVVDRTVTHQAAVECNDTTSGYAVAEEQQTDVSGSRWVEDERMRESGEYRINYDSLGRVVSIDYNRIVAARKDGVHAETSIRETKSMDSLAIRRHTAASFVDQEASTEKEVKPASESALFKIVLIAAGLLAGILFAIYLHRSK